jgi:hypothetical protein
LKQALSVNLAKADPRSGDHWSARVERNGDSWRITSYSESTHLMDRRANGAWILHFLETLETFRADSKVDGVTVNTITRGRYGFTPPRYAIQFQLLDEQAKIPVTHEIQIGAPVDFEKNPIGESYSIFPPNPDIFEANGAALQMLDYMKDFSSLRLQTLSTLESADVRGFELELNGKKILAAKRDQGHWTVELEDEKYSATQANFDEFLDRITHLRIQKFIDDASETAVITRALPHTPPFRIILQDRDSHPVSLAISKIGNQVYGTESNRGGAVFALYPEAMEKLSPR